MIFCNEWILKRVTSEFLQQATSATSNEQDFGTSNEWFFLNEQLLQRVTSAFLQQVTSATINKRILQRVANDFTTSNKQPVNLN